MPFGALWSQDICFYYQHSAGVKGRCPVLALRSSLMSLSENIVTLFPSTGRKYHFPALLFFFFPRKSHSSFASVRCLSLDSVWIPWACACFAVQLMGGSAILGFLDAGKLQTVQFPPDAYLRNPFLRVSCPLTFKQHHFQCQAACFKVWSATEAWNNSISASTSLQFP